MKYVIRVEKGEKTFTAYVSDMPGCSATADTLNRAMQLVQEAIDLHASADATSRLSTFGKRREDRVRGAWAEAIFRALKWERK
jgi:predicted RNase H-like HicB family nuclease